MKTYDIYFEIYGKKMKSKVMALSEDRAKDIVRYKIIFHKVVEQKDGKKGNLWDDEFKDLFSKLSGIK